MIMGLGVSAISVVDARLQSDFGPFEEGVVVPAGAGGAADYDGVVDCEGGG